MKKILCSFLLLLVSPFIFSQSPVVGKGPEIEPKQKQSYESAPWERMPRLNISNEDLQGERRTALVEITTDQNGNIIHCVIRKSTGIEKLDQKIILEVQRSKLKTPNNNENRQQYKFMQPFVLELNQEPIKRPWWKKLFFIYP